MGSVLSIITLVLALLFIVIEAGLGALRGTKRELCRIGSLVVIGLLLFFLVPGMGKALVLAVVNVFYPAGTTFTEVAGQITMELGMDAAAVGSIVETVLALGISLLVPFVFVTLFWLLKLISWPIFAVVCLIVKKTRKEEPQVTLNTTERLVGAAIGAVAGLFLGALTFMPLAQLNQSVEAMGNDTVADVAGDEVADAICFWSKAPAGGIYRVTQLETLFGLLYDSLSKVEIDDKVYRAKDLDELIALAPDAILLLEELEDANLEGFAAVADPLKNVAQGILDISLFTEEDKLALVQYLAAEGFAESADENALAAAALEGIEEMSYAELEHDVIAAIDLIVVLDKHRFTGVKNLDHLDASLFDEEFIEESADAIYKLNIAEQVLPPAIDMVIEGALSELGVEVVPCGNVADFKNSKQDFINVLSVMSALMGIADNAENLTTTSDVKAALSKIAELKNSVFISSDTYANLETALIKNTVSTAKVEETIQTAVKDHMEEVKQNASEDVEIDDDAIVKLQEAVMRYLNNPDDVSLEDIEELLTLLEDGTLMEGIDASVLEDIKNGKFDLADWMDKLGEIGL